MGYCVQADVVQEFKELTVADGAVITSALLDSWIADETAVINGRISTRYLTTPEITFAAYPDAYTILKRICVFRVSERVKNKLEVKNGITQLESEEKYEKNYVTTPNDDLDKIVKGTLILKGVGLVNTSLGINSFNSSQGVCRVFDPTKQQW